MSVLWQGVPRHVADRWSEAPRTVTLLKGDIVLREGKRVYVYGGQVQTERARDRKNEYETGE